jgi:tetratricopeptide (TPR) repeat protein
MQASGRLAEALAAYRSSVLLEPTLASGYNNIAACLLSLSSSPSSPSGLSEAREAYHVALGLNPRFAGMWPLLSLKLLVYAALSC